MIEIHLVRFSGVKSRVVFPFRINELITDILEDSTRTFHFSGNLSSGEGYGAETTIGEIDCLLFYVQQVIDCKRDNKNHCRKRKNPQSKQRRRQLRQSACYSHDF